MSDVEDQAAALRRLAERLDDTARRLAGLPAALADAWADPAGREWSDRLELVRRETVRRAAEAADLPGVGHGDGTDPDGTDPDGTDPDGTGSGPGVRLGGTTGTRTTDRRGVVAPLLPPYGSP